MVRWPGKIPAGSISNEIVQHHDWLPTFLALAGEPEIVEKLKKGHKAGDKTYKVHIDGYNLVPYLTGKVKKSPRQGLIYFDDDGNLVAMTNQFPPRHRGGNMSNGAEVIRLQQARDAKIPWRKWGPYLSERQWGTVREDYSQDGNAWDYFSHDQARSRAYHWGEDGLAGISDEKQLLCFSVALWNGKDPILKERLFGLTNSESNHGEDVKEYYFYLDSTPTHSYMKYLYKYPQAAFPYGDLIETSKRRNRREMEYELLDTGIFNADRYFDVFVEYAKQSPEDILIQISVCNRGPDAATLHVLPTLWFRNTWTWWAGTPKPILKQVPGKKGYQVVAASHATLGERYGTARAMLLCCSQRMRRTTSGFLARRTLLRG